MRLQIIKNIILCLFLFLLVNLFRMQIIKGPEYFKDSENNRIRLIYEEAARGIIYDRNQRPLIEHKLVFDVVASLAKKRIEENNPLFLNLSKFLDIRANALIDTYNYNYKSSFYPVLLAANVPRRIAFLIEQESARLPGVFIKPRIIRYYIYKKATAHLLGYLGKMREEDYPEFKKYGYRIQDLIGRSGLERSMDGRLRGEPGGMQLEVDSQGSIIRVLGYKSPTIGQDLYLTIDIKIQNFIYDLLLDQRGAIGIMDAQSGEILGLYSGPAYDPNILMDKKKYEETIQILKNKNAPFLNRNFCAYPPGSIFKIITAYAGLAQEKINIFTMIECLGVFRLGKASFNCWLKRGHNRIGVEDALAASCNIFFWETGLKIGPRLLSNYALDFGLGKLTRVELPEEQKGLIPNANWKKMKFNQRWYAGDTLNFSIGQGYLLITPLQALKMVALIANDGQEVRPHLLKDKKRNKQYKSMLSSEILSIIQNGMRKAMNTSYGTGRRANIAGLKIHAKTGTAQVSGILPHAWFIGYTQLKMRKICFVIFLEHGGAGGGKAADMAKEILLFLNKSYG